jgi:amidase
MRLQLWIGGGAAANLSAIAIGTETDGSIVCPAGSNAIVGLKPTVGLVAQAGIVPIAHSQDTAGPMSGPWTDAAIALNVLRSPFGSVRGRRLPRDYRASLVRGALRGARIGVDRRLFDGRRVDGRRG